ncbi:MAG: hypothetical protein ACK42L_09160, partial [Thermoanaerobaculum sp.]
MRGRIRLAWLAGEIRRLREAFPNVGKKKRTKLVEARRHTRGQLALGRWQTQMPRFHPTRIHPRRP